jgi:hypothetical protein
MRSLKPVQDALKPDGPGVGHLELTISELRPNSLILITLIPIDYDHLNASAGLKNLPGRR